jgi:hypothetical protein
MPPIHTASTGSKVHFADQMPKQRDCCPSCGQDPLAIQKANQAVVAAKQRQMSGNRLTMVWTRANDYVKKRDFESAYRLVLKDGDDMYLLRLLV